MTQQPYGSQPYAAQPPAPNPYQQNAYAAPAGYPPPAPQGYPPPGYGYPQQQNPVLGYPPQQRHPMEQQPAWGAGPQPTGLVCRFCGGYPAVEATVRGHQGLLVMMRFISLKGPFCRTCGIAVHREMTTRTMWQGWWGYVSFVITPFTLLYNLVPRSRFNALPQPLPGFKPPSAIGRPIFLRAGALGILAPLFALLLIVVGLSMGN